MIRFVRQTVSAVVETPRSTIARGRGWSICVQEARKDVTETAGEPRVNLVEGVIYTPPMSFIGIGNASCVAAIAHSLATCARVLGAA